MTITESSVLCVHNGSLAYGWALWFYTRVTNHEPSDIPPNSDLIIAGEMIAGLRKLVYNYLQDCLNHTVNETKTIVS